MSDAKKLLAIIATAAVLGGCDGGITGTGGPMTDMSDIIVGADSGPTVDGNTDPTGDVAVAALNSDIEFVNNTDASLRSDAIARIVHTVTGLPSVYAALNQDFTAPLIPQPGINFGDGADFYLSLPADTLELDMIALDAATDDTPTQIALSLIHI